LRGGGPSREDVHGGPSAGCSSRSKEIDRTFGPDYAREHPELVAVVVQSAASDYAALAIARGLQRIAAVLIEPEEEAVSSHVRLDLPFF
jgi:hypothetical protein